MIGDEHISFTTSKIGSLVDVNQSKWVVKLEYAITLLHKILKYCQLEAFWLNYINFVVGIQKDWEHSTT